MSFVSSISAIAIPVSPGIQSIALQTNVNLTSMSTPPFIAADNALVLRTGRLLSNHIARKDSYVLLGYISVDTSWSTAAYSVRRLLRLEFNNFKAMPAGSVDRDYPLLCYPSCWRYSRWFNSAVCWFNAH